LTALGIRVLARRLKLPEPVTNFRVERDLEVPMRDGVVLLADRYIPPRTPAGTVLMRGPYGRRGLPVEILTGLYAAYGYQVVLQSTRGGFGSGGQFDPGRHEVDDGADTVAWLRAQPWFDGRFATVGSSYLGFTQWALLIDPPPELTTAAIVMGPHDFGEIMWGTGAFALRDALGWNFQVAHQETGGTFWRLARTLTTSWRLRDELRKLPVGDIGDGVLAGGAPWHRSWIEHPDPSAEYWRPGRVGAALETATVPILLVTGWQDVFLDQTLQQYRRLRDRDVDVRLVVGPWTHSDGGGQTTRACLEWLRSSSAGDDDAFPAVRVFVVGSGWRDLSEWPPPVEDRTLYLHPGSLLAEGAPAPGAPPSRFVYNPAEATPTIGGRLLSGGSGYREDSALATRTDVAVFNSPALTGDMVVIGTPRVDLAHSVDTASADVFVRISDVDERGRSRNVSDGYRRIEPAVAGQLRIDLDPVAHRFSAGHRIRLTVAGGSYPRFARNLGTGEPALTATRFVRSTHTVDHGEGGLSRLLLPVTAA
jgi:uncharacterized protein